MPVLYIGVSEQRIYLQIQRRQGLRNGVVHIQSMGHCTRHPFVRQLRRKHVVEIQSHIESMGHPSREKRAIYNRDEVVLLRHSSNMETDNFHVGIDIRKTTVSRTSADCGGPRSIGLNFADAATFNLNVIPIGNCQPYRLAFSRRSNRDAQLSEERFEFWTREEIKRFVFSNIETIALLFRARC